MTKWQSKARTLTQQLMDAGTLDPSWREPFQNIPRHHFVPRFYKDDVTLLDGSQPQQREEWLDAVYQDESLTTQQARIPGTNLIWPTSSSTRPSLMARMLDLLDVQPGHRVLEIGTGTGYNTALLCHRVGAGNVASIDIDANLVATARTRLAELGQHPILVAGDGAQGIPHTAPFDRIIATCAVPAIPSPWINQLRKGGVVVTDLRGEISSNLITFRKIDAATVEGRFLRTPGHFMWLRPRAESPLREGDGFTHTVNRDGASKRWTRLNPTILDDPDLRFFLQLRLPTIQTIWRTVRDTAELLCIHSRDGAWAETSTMTLDHPYTVTQGGPRQLWDQVEHIAALWSQLGRPSAGRFGLTVTTCQQLLWLDTPESEHRWLL